MEKIEVIKLLAIDDKADNLTALSALVQDALPQTRVLTATNGPAGIELAAAEDPDVILLDIVMPGMDGFEVCRRLKADERIKDIPVVFLTALKTDTASRVKGLEAGAEGFLAKPLETVELTAQIRTMTKIKAANRSRLTEKDRLEAMVAERTRELELEITERKQAEKARRQSDARFRTAQEISPDGFTILTPVRDIQNRVIDFIWVYENDSIARLNGTDPKKVVGQRLLELFPGHRDTQFIKAYQQVAESGKSITFEEGYSGESMQKQVWFRIVVVPMAEDIAVLAQDITERKQAEADLRNAERQLRSTVDGLSAHIAVLDEYGEIILTNKSYRDFAEQNGIEPRAVSEGTNYLAVCDTVSGSEHSEEAKPFAEGIREVLSGKRQSFELEYPCHAPDEKRWFIGRVTPFAGKGPRRVIIAHENITERIGEALLRKQAEETLIASRELLAETERIGKVGGWSFSIDTMVQKWTDEVYHIHEVEISPNPSVEAGINYYTKESRPIIEKAVERAIEHGENFDLELEIITPKGNTRAVHTIGKTDLKNRRIYGFFQDITERKRADEDLHQTQAILQAAMDCSPAGIAIADAPDGRLRYVNDAGLLIGGEDRQSLVNGVGIEQYVASWKLFDLDGRPLGIDEVPLARAIMFGETNSRDFIIRREEGEDRIVEANAAPIKNETGKIVAGIVVFTDITEKLHKEKEQAKLQEQFQQAQKMESVGRLAGGVAHDFNNMLSIILGYGEIALDKLHQGDPLREDMQEIVEAGRRSAALTRQLLAFSRKQTLQPEVLDLNHLVRELDKMLHRLIGEDIELKLALAEDLGWVKVDPGQIDQVIMNLVINARDAMPKGGKLLIETADVELDTTYTEKHPGSKPGKYVMLAVTDTGCGMSKEILDQIFDPFFTTKEKDRGTGLGLSTVYGIVKQSDGNVWVYSEPGQGTTFKVYFPNAEAVEESAFVRPEAVAPVTGGEHILVVEDEEGLRKLMASLLSQLGYTVTLAANGGEALLLVEEKGLKPDMVITDVIMPNMSGKVLIDRLRRDDPHLKALFMSGYTDNAIVNQGALDPRTPFIQKPFNIRDLGQKVQDVLRGGGKN